MKQDLRDLTHAETRAFAGTLGVEPYRGDQIFRWVHGRRVARVEAMTDLAKDLRARVADAAEVRMLAVDAEQVSRDGTRKLRLRTDDGRMIETVLIPDGDAAAPDDDLEDETAQEPEHLQHALFPKRPKLTQCVSSQVGCALDCSFCATAKLGFGRQLTAGEIVDQVYRAQDIVSALGEDDPTRRAGADRVTNLVFMGMGEPLHNYKNLVRALDILTDGAGADFSRRRITVSTAGLVPGIEKLAAETKTALRVNLAVSLNASTDEQRDVLMPINKKWNIARLLEAVRKFPLEKRRRVTFEYVLLDGVNDSEADAERVSRLLRGIPSKVNVIPWNPHELTDGTIPYRRPSDERVRTFQAALKARGLAVYVRRPRGDDIDAACGQLAAKGTPGLVPLRTS
ncbi:MAG TPA: 23S rRNA (adenine(2503)-C(2))-methyltransferase RlmN [Polyangia bacterium]|nr:23S rRNA (adenine(2503)-C(2))-methyltransferase RlmN [Polyangia bacterium]